MNKPQNRIRHLALVSGLTMALALAGCSTPPTTQQVGTGVGAVAGGAVGHVLFGSTLGTVGSAAAGALIGSEVGKRQR